MKRKKKQAAAEGSNGIAWGFFSRAHIEANRRRRVSRKRARKAKAHWKYVNDRRVT